MLPAKLALRVLSALPVQSELLVRPEQRVQLVKLALSDLLA